MKQFVTILLAGLAVAVTRPALAVDVSKDIAARVEAIPIQTLTISDEQFLKGDAYGRPTTIAGVLRIAQGSGRLPLVVLVPGSGGITNADVWDRQFETMGVSTFEMDSFAGRGIVSTIVDQSQLGRLNMISQSGSLGRAPASRSEAHRCHGILARRAGDTLCEPQTIP